MTSKNSKLAATKEGTASDYYFIPANKKIRRMNIAIVIFDFSSSLGKLI